MTQYKICKKCKYRSHYPFDSIKDYLGYKCPLCKNKEFINVAKENNKENTK